MMMQQNREKNNIISFKMAQPNRKYIWIILGIILLISMSSEFADMAKQTSLQDALLGFVILTLLVLGIVYWIKRSKR